MSVLASHHHCKSRLGKLVHKEWGSMRSENYNEVVQFHSWLQPSSPGGEEGLWPGWEGGGRVGGWRGATSDIKTCSQAELLYTEELPW